MTSGVYNVIMDDMENLGENSHIFHGLTLSMAQHWSLSVVHKMRRSYRFSEVLKKSLVDDQILRRLKKGHKRFLDLKTGAPETGIPPNLSRTIQCVQFCLKCL